MPYLPELHTIDEAVMYFTNLIGAQTVVIAERAGAIVGYCAFRNEWLDHLYVHPEHQRQGTGARLLREAMAEKERLRLWVFQKNVDAMRFYERHGFTRIQATDGADNEEREPDVLYEWHQ